MKEIRSLFAVTPFLFFITIAAVGMQTPASGGTTPYRSSAHLLQKITFGMENVDKLHTCATKQLEWVPGIEGATMGQVGMIGAGFRNISQFTCTLKGFPKLQLIDTTNHAAPTYLTYGNTPSSGAELPTLVILQPGAEAYFDLGYTSATGFGNSECPLSLKVRITPPQTKKYLMVLWQMQPNGGTTIDAPPCGQIKVSHLYARG